jgi:hypothetical protein
VCLISNLVIAGSILIHLFKLERVSASRLIATGLTKKSVSHGESWVLTELNSICINRSCPSDSRLQKSGWSEAVFPWTDFICGWYLISFTLKSFQIKEIKEIIRKLTGVVPLVKFLWVAYVLYRSPNMLRIRNIYWYNSLGIGCVGSWCLYRLPIVVIVSKFSGPIINAYRYTYMHTYIFTYIYIHTYMD